MSDEADKRIEELQQEIEQLEVQVSAKRREISEIQQRQLNNEPSIR